MKQSFIGNHFRFSARIQYLYLYFHKFLFNFKASSVFSCCLWGRHCQRWIRKYWDSFETWFLEKCSSYIELYAEKYTVAGPMFKGQVRDQANLFINILKNAVVLKLDLDYLSLFFNTFHSYSQISPHPISPPLLNPVFPVPFPPIR